MRTQVADRRTGILSAAAELFARDGVAGTSVRDIAQQVGVAPGALYYYFSSKDEMVREILVGYLTSLRDEYGRRAPSSLPPRERLRAIVEVSVETADREPYATQVYQSELPNLRRSREYRRAKVLADEVQQVWLDAIDAGRAVGVFRRDVPAKVFHRFLRDAVWLSVRWRRPGDPYTPAELARDCMAVFLDGVAVRRSRLKGSAGTRSSGPEPSERFGRA